MVTSLHESLEVVSLAETHPCTHRADQQVLKTTQLRVLLLLKTKRTIRIIHVYDVKPNHESTRFYASHLAILVLTIFIAENLI